MINFAGGGGVIKWRTDRKRHVKILKDGKGKPILKENGEEVKIVESIPKGVECQIWADGQLMAESKVKCKSPDRFVHKEGRVESACSAIKHLTDKKLRKELYEAVFAKYPGIHPESHKTSKV